MIVPGKQVVKEEINVFDTDINDEKQHYFTQKFSKIAFDVNIRIHHNKQANSQPTIFSKFDITGIAINHINKVMEELSRFYAKLINQYKFKHQLTFLIFLNE